jgi:hypothetical protein
MLSNAFVTFGLVTVNASTDASAVLEILPVADATLTFEYRLICCDVSEIYWIRLTAISAPNRG